MPGRVGTVDEWARTLRVTRQAAYKRIREFHIPLRNGKLDFDEADRISEASLSPSKRAAAATTAAAREAQGDLFGNGHTGSNGGGGGVDVADDVAPGLNGLSGKLPATAIARVQLARDMSRASLERIRLEQLQGKLVAVDQVTRFYAEVFARLRDEFASIGAEIMDALATAEDAIECREIVDRRIEKALRSMAEWKPEQR